MRNMIQALSLAVLLFFGIQAQQKPLPRFEDFPVSRIFKGKPASVKLSSPRARMFRTVLRTNAEGGVNFAGHCIVATWGCGSDCHSLAIIDARTGNVYFTPSLLWIGGLPFQEQDRLQFRKDSGLLIAAGGRNDIGGGRYFYIWRGNRLKLIRAVKVSDVDDVIPPISPRS